MEYIFRTSEYDVEQLVPEVSVVLEKRVELASRQRLPGMWKATDSMAQKNGTPRPMTRGQLIYRRVVGIALILLGLFMMIPGLMKPQELLLPLFVGFCGLVFGINALWSTRKKRVSRFEKAARTFLSAISKAESTEICFTEDGMLIGDQPLISYADMEYFIETRSGYLFTWAKQAVFLQKKDLREGDPMEFASFMTGRI